MFFKREKLVEKYIEDEAQIYFSRTEKIKDKFTKSFCKQIILSIIGDSYDMFNYLQNDSNIFYKRANALNSVTNKKIFKWLSIYHAAIFLPSICEESRKSTLESMKKVFKWSAHDFNVYKELSQMNDQNTSEFEVVFAKKIVKDIFKIKLKNPITLAIISNLFYNFHNMFRKEILHV